MYVQPTRARPPSRCIVDMPLRLLALAKNRIARHEEARRRGKRAIGKFILESTQTYL